MKRGFTLIELLVVVAIIGMLSSVVLASLNTARASARDARRQQDLKQIQTALELYHTVRGTYPGETWCDSSKGSSGSTGCGGVEDGDWDQNTSFYRELVTVEKVIPDLPKDPTNTGIYYYSYEPGNSPTYVSRQNYCLKATLERGGTFILSDGNPAPTSC